MGDREQSTVPIYRLEYVIRGQRPRTVEYPSGEPLQPGQRIWADGLQLLVDRVVRNKPGDRGPELVLCSLISR